jgi:hypothetical protein
MSHRAATILCALIGGALFVAWFWRLTYGDGHNVDAARMLGNFFAGAVVGALVGHFATRKAPKA